MEHYSVYIDGKLIGVAKNVELDFPNMMGAFKPTEEFELIKPFSIWNIKLQLEERMAGVKLDAKCLREGLP